MVNRHSILFFLNIYVQKKCKTPYFLKNLSFAHVFKELLVYNYFSRVSLVEDIFKMLKIQNKSSK